MKERPNLGEMIDEIQKMIDENQRSLVRFIHVGTLMDILYLLKEHGKPDCEHAEHDGIGCLGYAGCTQDDEPIEVCKECEKYTGNVYRVVKRND